MGASMALSGFSRIDLRSQTGGVPNLDAEDVPWVDGGRLGVEGGANWAAEQDDDRNFSFDGLEWGIGTPVGVRHVITRDAYGTPVAVDADDTTANVRAQLWGPTGNS
ncbi:MAG: hypothetical protein EXR71_17895 [Myxococcales bacterium]|nr:hypothetical protein [Myxococcales bacterium]